MPVSKKEVPENEDSFKRGFKNQAEKLALDYRRLLHYKEYDRLPAIKLAEFLNIEVVPHDEIPGISSSALQELLYGPGANSWSAVTIGQPPALIIYNHTHSPGRIESDLMHELAHVILKHEMDSIDTSFGLPLREYDRRKENEADWLGSCLLLPKPALVKYFVFKQFTVEQIAEHFNASVQMVNYRLGISGVRFIKGRLKSKASN